MVSRSRQSHSSKSEIKDVKGNPFNQDAAEVRAARISSVYHDEHHPVKVDRRNTVGDTRSLREQILKVSLFPNIYNRSTVKSQD